MNSGSHISLDDLALYAMQSLSPEETASVRAHLASCEQCRNEVAQFEEGMLALAISTEPHDLPPNLRQRFLDSLATGSAAPAATTPAALPSPSSPVVMRPRATVWIPWAAAAALAITTTGLAVRNYTLHQILAQQAQQNASLTTENTYARRVLQVLTARDAQHVVLTAAKTPPAPTGRTTYLARSGELIFQGSNLAPLPPDKTYELWLIPANGSPSLPAGTFRPDAHGNASLVFPKLSPGIPAKGFGITIEHAEGSQTPTLPIVLMGTTPSAGE